MVKKYDYIVTGGGAAGRSFLSHLAQSPLRDKRILLIDRAAKDTNDRTWCFWEKEPGFFEAIVFHSWEHLWVHTSQFSRLLSIHPYRYKLIRGIDFYRYTDELIDRLPQLERLPGRVDKINATESGVEVIVEGRQFSADWCFNSIFFGEIDKQESNYLDQHFRGWFIRARSDVFQPGQAVLMDFRLPQQQETRFLYVLPYSEREALVEVAIFSNQHLSPAEYDEIIETYLRVYLPGLQDFSVVQVEMGNIPMTSYPFKRSEGRVVHLGMAGGDTRASSGYTFYNIQKRVAEIVRQLTAGKPPILSPVSPARRASFYDAIMLRVLENGYCAGDVIFERLFAGNPPQAVLAFLNAESNLWTELKLVNSLPKWPFVRALLEEIR